MMNTFTVARTFGIALVLFFASAVCHAGALPDLNGQLNGLEQAIKGTPCFDPQQPWYVCFVIGNVHTTGSDPVKGATGPFNLTLEIMKGPGLSSGVFNTVSKNVPEGIGAGNLLEVCFQLPKKFDHNDLGTKHAFRLTIDSPLPKGIVAEDNENNNVVEFGDGTAVPLAPDSSLPQAPAPDKNLKIIDTAAFP